MLRALVPAATSLLACGRLDFDAHGPRDAAGVAPTFAASNGIAMAFAGEGSIVISGTTTFDTDSGTITGGVTRGAGEGVDAGVGFQLTTFAGAPLAVFRFHALEVAGTVRLVGSRAAVFLVETTATIDGTIDSSGGCFGSDRRCAGPGGGAGGLYGATAGGCGPGGRGTTDVPTGADTGGGGGGGGGDGAAGGIETAASTMFPGGVGGSGCLATTLEPLIGGSGGGGGGPGAGIPTPGGGGGGGLQITALAELDIAGAIDVGGGGGETGPTDVSNGGAGGGGGGGGGVLLEAPVVTLVGVVAANGGGGGGGADHLVPGAPGQDGQIGATPASGGLGANLAGAGGNGGAAAIAPSQGGNATNVNAGAGGGGAGRIYIRATTLSLAGTTSPAAGTGPLQPPR